MKPASKKPTSKKPTPSPNDELSDHALDKVAGGGQPPAQGGKPVDDDVRETPTG